MSCVQKKPGIELSNDILGGIILPLLIIFIINAFMVTNTCAAQDGCTGQDTERMYFDNAKIVGPTQMQMNFQASDEFIRAEDALDNTYSQVLALYQDDPAFIAKLVHAEFTWITFRNADLEALYPTTDKCLFGSIFPLMFYSEKTKLTWARVRQLKEWRDGLPNGPDSAIAGIDYTRLTGTQQELNEKAGNEFKRADDSLNNVYKQILIMYKDDKLFIAKLRNAELAWITFKDAEIEAVNAVQNKTRRYGRFAPQAGDIEKTRLTRARVEQLNAWSEGLPQGGHWGSRGGNPINLD